MTASFSKGELAALFDPVRSESNIALAVSGGSDSMALLTLAERWAGARLTVLTVDHGLRPESAAEAAMVARHCADRGIDHLTLHWTADGQGNLAQSARIGRYTLMYQACRDREITSLLTGHTLDDQAETVLMRLARGSGVDGLAGMTAVRAAGDFRLIRPLLKVSRAQLRDVLRVEGVPWVDDPSNDDRTKTRIQARDALARLAPMGLDAKRLSDTAAMMAKARDVLDAQADALAEVAGVADPLGYIVLETAPLASAAPETALRLLARALCSVSGQVYRPRLRSVEALLTDFANPDFAGCTLHGCILEPCGGGRVRIQREPSACLARITRVTSSRVLWDNRFWVDIPRALADDLDIHIAATGPEALKYIKEKKGPVIKSWAGAPRPARLTVPALWRRETLLAIPHAGHFSDPATQGCIASSAVTIKSSQVDPAVSAFIYSHINRPVERPIGSHV